MAARRIASDVVISRRNDRRLGVSGTDWVKNGDRWIVTDVRADGALSVRHATSRLHATLPAAYVREHVELGYASTVHTAQGITTDVVHGIVTGTEDRQMLYTMLTRGRVENHAHIVLDTDSTHALPSPDGRAGDDGDRGARRHPRPRRSRRLRHVDAGPCHVARCAVAGRRHSVRGRSCARNVPDASRPRLRRARSAPLARRHPFRGRPSHSAWGPYLAARSRRVSSLAAEVAADPVLPEWTAKYDDVLTPELRRELAVWRAATGVPADERTLAGPVPHDDREAAYHRNLTSRINARYGEAVKTWADRIVEYVGRRDEQTGELAKYLDQLARKGIDAERVLDLAAARKPLPVDHPTAALAFRVKDLVTPRNTPSSPVDRPVPATEPAAVRPVTGVLIALWLGMYLQDRYTPSHEVEGCSPRARRGHRLSVGHGDVGSGQHARRHPAGFVATRRRGAPGEARPRRLQGCRRSWRPVRRSPSGMAEHRAQAFGLRAQQEPRWRRRVRGCVCCSPARHR